MPSIWTLRSSVFWTLDSLLEATRRTNQSMPSWRTVSVSSRMSTFSSGRPSIASVETSTGSAAGAGSVAGAAASAWGSVSAVCCSSVVMVGSCASRAGVVGRGGRLRSR
jgi:hypothetical protein